MKREYILITGGAGYIGSHITNELLKNNYNVLVLDNLNKGHKQAVINADFIEGDFGDIKKLEFIFKKYNIKSVVHMAAYSEVGDSCINPEKYFDNNLKKSIILLNLMLKYNIKYFVFSSTAAVYGEPNQIPITELCSTNPTNPYGESKLMFEKILNYYGKSYGLKFISLRYFNAAGASLEFDIGEDHKPETHLIPIVLQVASGLKKQILIFGNDYETKDGTCIRDYIHVLDIAKAHILSLNALYNGHLNSIYNLGNGAGFSVNEIIETARKITGHPIPSIIKKRREGDPPILIANCDKIIKDLKWHSEYCNIEEIINSAWCWHKKHPNGY